MAREIAFILNDADVRTGVPPGTVLLDFIRRDRRLTGTREGCREGDCGACTILLGGTEQGRVRYRSVVSCLLPLGEAEKRHVVTIEGLNGGELTPIQQALVSEGASQCGFCTPGIVVSLTAFLLNSRGLQSEEAITAIQGNVCRCTGYTSVRRAVDRLLRELRPPLQGVPDRVKALIGLGVLPAYFAGIVPRLLALGEAKPAKPPAKKTDAVVLGGGTDLYVQRGYELPDRELLLISRQTGYAGIWPGPDRIFIGGATTMEDIRNSPLLQVVLPDLARQLLSVSSLQVRNRATIGGNIVNASPIADLSIIFLALDARVALFGPKGMRELPLGDFFLGYKKLALQKNELMVWVSIPVPENGWCFSFEKVGRRRTQDIASVNSGLGLQMAGERIAVAHVSAGGVAPVPLYLKAASAFLAGKEVSPGLVRELAQVADKEIAPISDVRGSATYKRALLRRLLAAHFLELFPGRFAAGDLP
jgi:xanthine dehydrogenase small subunit